MIKYENIISLYKMGSYKIGLRKINWKKTPIVNQKPKVFTKKIFDNKKQ